MTMNPQWGGGLNPPEPMPMGGAKSMRSDPGFIGGGLPSSGGGGGGIGGRQITKNPLNMLGGMGSTSNGVYTNGSSSSFDQAVRGGGGGVGVGFPGDRINGSADRVRAPGTNMPQVQGSGIERMSAGGQGLDRMPSGGLDRMPTSGLDRMPTSGLDRMPTSGLDRMPTSGLDRMPTSGLDRMPSSGLDRMPTSGLDRMPTSGLDRMPTSGLDRMPTSSLDRMPTSGLDRMGSGGGLDRMAAGGGLDRMTGGGMDRMSGGGLDRMSAGGLDRMSSGGMDRMSASGLDRMSSGLDRMPSAGLDRMSSSGLDRMSSGLDRMPSGGLDRMSSGMDRMPSGGLDRMTGGGLDRMSGGGLDRMPSGGLDRMSSGLDRMPSGGLDRMSGGMDRMSGGGLDRMSGGGLDRMSGGGLDRMSGGGMDRMSGGNGMNGGMGGMMNKMGSGFGGGGGMEGGYGMSLNRPQQRSPPSSRFNGFSGSIGDRSISNGNISSMGGAGGDRMPPSFPDNNRGGDMRDIMNQRDRDMMGGGSGGMGAGSGDSRGFFRDLVDTRGHDPRSIGGGAPDHRMTRDYQLQQEMRERDMYRMRDNNLVRSNSEMGPERNLAMLDRATSGGSMMSRGGNMPPRDMLAGNSGGRDYMRSNSDMMGGTGGMSGGRDRMDMMGGGGRDRMDMMGGGNNRVDMMGGGNNRMDMSSYPPRDMMSQRSISMNNGGGSNGGGGYGMGSSVGGNMDNGYNRSMSYNNGPSSPPGGSDLKIGTWNDGGSAGNSGAANPPVSNFEIGTFNMNSVSSSNENRNNYNSMGTFGGGHHSGTGNGTTQSNNGPFQPGMGIRETGIIEKLLHSYGFIQCCDRQARLFFHFSQFEGNIEHLKIGDPVEFEMTYDRRTGKPIASAVSKIAPEVVMSEERVIGTVTTELKVNAENGNETAGRISYENRGECFFLPFNTTDVEGNVTLTSGDKVSFQMATVARSGNLAAKTIRLENPAAPVKYRGVVNSLQDAFGFIERADVVKEIYFNIIDMQDGVKEDNSGIHLGDDVEFIIQTRAGKEVAANLLKLSPGTVVFEDIGTEWFRGQVLKPLDRSGKYQQTEALPGKVKYRAADRSEAEIPFGEKDQLGDFTLKHGDWIKFIVATDRRDKLKRATKIELLDESFSVSDERREQGVVQQVKDGGIGYIKCVDRSDSIMFHFSECLDVSRKVTIGDEMEFTLFQDPKQMLATRIKYLAAGTVKFDIIIAHNILGVVAEEPTTGQSGGWGEQVSPSKLGSESPAREGAGRIVYELNSVQLSIPVYAGDCEARNPPRLGDKVQFNINQLKATKETNAMNVHVLERANIELPSNTGSANVSGDSDEALALSGGGSSVGSKSPTPPMAAALQDAASPQTVTPQPEATAESDTTTSPSPPKEKKDLSRLGSPQRGYVAALKDGFGFIETLQHDKEIFFHFSHVEGKADKLEVGQEVEYYVYSREKGGKVSAEGVKVLPKGSIPKPVVKEEMLYGKVARPLRSVNPDQADYCGLIVSKSEEGKILAEYQFGIASLLNKKELLQEGDPVNFQVSSNEPFAYNIKSNKQKLRSNVEAVKGQFGFLTYEQEEGKKLFFHMSEVEGGEVLQVGDQVEFVVVTNSRTKKHSACCVRKLGASQRPERLISKLKALSMEEGTRGGPKLIAIRPPRGPDGTRGFSQPRAKVEEQPCIDLMEQLTAQ